MAVLKILIDETYIGKIMNNMRETPDVNNKRTVAVPREQWIAVPNTHEAIMDEDLFEQAQSTIIKISKHKEYKVDHTRIHLRKIKYGICKKNLQQYHIKIPHYICKSNYFEENCLFYHGRTKEPMILEAIRKQAQFANKVEKIILKTKTKSENEVATLIQTTRKHQQSIERKMP